MTSPWADPATPTEPGAPYAGPPATAPSPASPYGPPVFGAGPHGPPQYGMPPYGMHPSYGPPPPWGPLPPRRPAQLITAAVLAFVQSAMVLIASLYVWFFASLADVVAQESQGAFSPATADGLAREGTVIALVQLVSFLLLVAGGIRALVARTRRAWRLLLAAHVVQVVLSLYWAIRLTMLIDGTSGPDAGGVLTAFCLFFAAGPVVAIGLLLTRTARGWFAPAVPKAASPQV